MEMQRKNMNSVSPGNGISLSRGNLLPEWIVLKKRRGRKKRGPVEPQGFANVFRLKMTYLGFYTGASENKQEIPG